MPLGIPSGPTAPRADRLFSVQRDLTQTRTIRNRNGGEAPPFQVVINQQEATDFRLEVLRRQGVSNFIDETV